MIHYQRGRICNALTSVSLLGNSNIFKNAFIVAFPAAVVAAVVKLLDTELPTEYNNFLEKIVVAGAYSSFTFLVGLTVVFRTSQSYHRYWDGCEAAYGMMADFFDVASSLVAFCRATPREKINEVKDFQHKIIRLFSLLHALILADLEAEGSIAGSERAYTFQLIDLEGLDSESLKTIVSCEHKVDLVFQWIQALIVEAMNFEILVLPAPILTRAFQELNAGMVQYHKALKIAECPFPFPYTAAAEMVLVLHWLITPIVVGTWTTYAWSAAFFSFINVFILWSMNGIASELENPFESDLNDLDMADLQRNLNERLLMLLDNGTYRTPKLTKAACLGVRSLRDRSSRLKGLNSIADLIANPPKDYEGPCDDFDFGLGERVEEPAKSSEPPASETDYEMTLKKGATARLSLWDDEGSSKRPSHIPQKISYQNQARNASTPLKNAGVEDSVAKEDAVLIGQARAEADINLKDPIVTTLSPSREHPSQRGPRTSPLLQPVVATRDTTSARTVADSSMYDDNSSCPI